MTYKMSYLLFYPKVNIFATGDCNSFFREDDKLNFRTIESELYAALVKAGVITEESVAQPGKLVSI